MTRFRFALALLLPAALILSACGGAGSGAAQEAADDRALGDLEAPVQVIEYASITCSHCKTWHDDVWPQVKQELVDAGKVRFIFRELPTAPQDISVAGFLIARCAPADRYFNVLDALFGRQERLFTANARDELLAVARAVGMTEEHFNACIRDQAQIDAMNRRVEEGGRRYNVNSTPTFIINGRVHVGAQPFQVFADAVAAAEQ